MKGRIVHQYDLPRTQLNYAVAAAKAAAEILREQGLHVTTIYFMRLKKVHLGDQNSGQLHRQL